MYTLAFTLAAGATPIVPKSNVGILSGPISQFQQVKIQNPNATNAIYVGGDPSVTSSTGFKIAAGASETFTPFEYGEDLKSWYLVPTAANDKAIVLVIP